MDNNDFKHGTLMEANTPHHIVMFVHPENQAQVDLENCCSVLVNWKDLKILSDQQNKVRPFKTIKKDVSLVRKSFNIAPKTTKPMQLEQMRHSILWLDNEHEPITPKVETVVSFAGSQAWIQSKPQENKPYYFVTLSTTPHKSEVCEVVSHLADVIEERRMLFLQLISYQLV